VAAVAARPDDADALIWLGRRTAYLGRYREAVEIFSRGIAQHPDDPRFLRHRGHRYITLRRFDLAAADLEQAAAMIRGREDEVEPDGLPNARNIPTSTLQSNIWYHLGLARYLDEDFKGARAAYNECLAVSKNPDMLVATSNWLYLTLRRLHRDAEARKVLAPIHGGLDVIENGAYHRLLLLYRGDLKREDLLPAGGGGELDPVTVGYGLGALYLANGYPEQAVEEFHAVVARGQWASFGHIAAEAELYHLGEYPPP
jgi:tetratricopeptide (TPR) repeat protein